MDFEANLNEINECLSKGNLPKQLDFSDMLNTNCSLDVDLIKYNAFFKSFEAKEEKLPIDISFLPGYKDVLNLYEPKYESPLEELMSVKSKLSPISENGSETDYSSITSQSSITVSER